MQRATLENNLPAWVRSWAPLPRFVPSACQNPGGAFPKTDMQTTMNITITNVKNANELDSFIPVEGEWFSTPTGAPLSARYLHLENF